MWGFATDGTKFGTDPNVSFRGQKLERLVCSTFVNACFLIFKNVPSNTSDITVVINGTSHIFSNRSGTFYCTEDGLFINSTGSYNIILR